MAELHSWCEPIDDIEAMVRAAGDYVQASDDLRPRVLETARIQSGEQRAQRRIRRMAILFVLLAMFTPSSRDPVEAAGDHPWNTLSVASSESAFSQTAAAVDRGGGDFGWGLVEAFTELRHQQAAALRTGR